MNSTHATVQAKPPAAVLLGREIVSTDTSSGDVRLRFLARHEFSNRYGTVQGGILAAMLDSAAGATLMMVLPAGRKAVTVRLDTTFLRAAYPGTLFANAHVVSCDDSDAKIATEIRDADDKTLASATVVFRIIAVKGSAMR